MAETKAKVEYVTHPLIRENTVERRAYQISIAATALMYNTLVILPTGLGKTTIALLVIASRLLNEGGKALVLAPTKPLVEQHASFFRRTMKLKEEEIVALSGEIRPEKRVEIWSRARLVISTPQVIENDLLADRISLEDVVHVTFDEAHRAVGDYAYVYIADEYFKQARKPLVLGMTASPGSDIERIKEVIRNLRIEAIEIRTENDDDVRPYVHGRKVEWIKVEMPKELKEIRDLINKAMERRLKKLEKLGIKAGGLAKKELLSLQESLQAQAAETGEEELFEAVSVLAEVLKLYHGLELVETEGVEALKEYLKKLVNEAHSVGGSKAAKNIVNDPIFKEILKKVSTCRVEHPKLEKLVEVVKDQLRKNPDSRIIVFTNYRDTAETIAERLKREGIRAERFVGQAKRGEKKGMTQKEQIETLEKFRNGEIQVLVATSVGEEGLDIPSTDLVVFYEAVPSEIRAIQRKGRTGRAREGRIVVLITKGTRDEAYYWASVRKERAMYAKLYELREELMKRVAGKNWFSRSSAVDESKTEQITEVEIIGEKRKEEKKETGEVKEGEKEKEQAKKFAGVKIYVDSREAQSGIAKKLKEMGVEVEMKALSVADYVLSDRVAVERKTDRDFVESIVKKDRDLFNQLARLKSAYSRPLLIIEGENLYRINPTAVRGAIAAITVDFGIPVIWTRNSDETAEYLAIIARREQVIKKRKPALHDGKTKKTLKEMQEYVVSSLSNVGPVTAKNLLDYFQTVERIVTAKEDELTKVPNVGLKTARRIRKLVTTPYSKAGNVFEDSD